MRGSSLVNGEPGGSSLDARPVLGATRGREKGEGG